LGNISFKQLKCQPDSGDAFSRILLWLFPYKGKF
jgi:hypothetical protein